jgi:hypothetical protein
MKDNVTLNYFFNKLSCFKSFNSFLDEIFFLNSSVDNLNNDKKSSKFIIFYKKWFFLNDFYFYVVDTLYIYMYYYIYSKFTLLSFYKNNKINLKLTQTKSNFIYNLNNGDYNQTLLLFSYGLKSIWKAIRLWIFSIIVGVTIIYYCLVVKLLPFTKIIFAWFLLTMFFYWLVSGFVFFFKKYQYRYFTSSIQRFWRRSFILFWSIEAFLFIIFIYLTLNSNQEPVFMYDESQVYKTHLFSWRYFIIKIFPATLLIIFSYFILLSLKWNVFSKSNFLCLLVTALLGYILWQEFYQFFHLMSFYGNLAWVYDIEEHLWNLEVEFRRTRITNHYVTICLVAKFWHLVFVVIFWMFFVLRSLEFGRIRYPLMSANFQNFIIVYIMSWAYMYPWFKYIWKKFLEMPYFWFYVNTRRMGLFIFFNDFKLFFLSVSSTFSELLFFWNNSTNYHFNNFNFFYWHNSSDVTGYSQYKKNFIRDNFIKNVCN